MAKRLGKAARLERNAAMRARYEEGATVRELGEAFQLTHSQVASILRDAGVTMRPRGGASLNPLGKNQYTEAGDVSR